MPRVRRFYSEIFDFVKSKSEGISKFILFLAVISGLTFLLVLSLTSINSLDLFLHLKAGEVITYTKSPIFYDVFSFTRYGKEWVDHSWFFQFFIYQVYRLWGFRGLHYLKSILVILSFIFISSVTPRRNYLWLALCFLFSGFLLGRFISTRPALFSLLFLSFYIMALERKKKSFLYLLPLVQVLWVNSHGYFLLGLAIVWIYIVIGFFEKEEYRFTLLATGVLCTASSFVNPYFHKGLLYPLKALFFHMGNPQISSRIKELQSLLRASSQVELFSFMMLGILAVFSVIRRNLKIFSRALLLVVLSVVGFAAYYSLRNIPFFVVLCSGFVISGFTTTFSTRINRIFNPIIGIILLGVFLFSTNRKLDEIYFDDLSFRFKSGVLEVFNARYPERAVEFVLRERLPRLFNDFNSGAYLIGKTCPLRRVFIDGRTEFYGKKFLDDYFKLTLNPQDKIFSRTVDKYSLKGFFISYAASNSARPLIKYISGRPDFYPVYFDSQAVIFLKDEPSNERFKNLKIDFKDYQPPAIDVAKVPLNFFPAAGLRRAQVLWEMGQLQACQRELSQILEFCPQCAQAYRLMGDIYFKKKYWQKALFSYRKSLIFSRGSSHTYKNLGICLFHLGKYKLSLKEFRNAIKRGLKDKEIEDYLGKIIEKLKVRSQQ